ncbi:MAG TPA: M20 family metallopeptidase, partial [Actinomycetota bacterium]|nr:M20 family metallopeptidase [Actinomycetota bacterium]
ELAYEEVRSAELLCELLEGNGMTVERSAHGLKTAFRATAGTSGPHVIICAEYDALPEIGHACGHNIIGTASIGAAIALSELAGDLGVRVTILGTPAEESGGGKIDLLKAGAFDGADLAMMVHPAPLEVVDFPTLAWADVKINYHGRESHASAFPQRGLNALDAVVSSYQAVAQLRQHIAQSERIHGIITHGGDAPNIVPKLCSARYFIRAANLDDLDVLKSRVLKCFEAGAVGSGCELEVHWVGNNYDVVMMNPTVGALYENNLQTLGRTAIPRAVVERAAGSTDMGNVSQVLPAIHPMISIDSMPAVNHQADFAAATVQPAGDKAIADAATAMAWTVIDLAADDAAIERMKQEFEAGPQPSDAALFN